MADINIEETNRIRIALGMQPLPVPGAPAGPVFRESKGGSGSSDEEPASTYETRHALASDNWQRLQAEEEAKAKRQAQKDAIKKARDQARRFAKLEGKGLGDADDGRDVDTKTWLLQQKKRQKKIDKARKLEEELAAQEREQQAEYTSADLAGVKVGHELDQLDAGGEQVLTLKDAAVDAEEEEDELENLDLRAQEQLHERLEVKKRKPVYNPNAVDESGESSILAQYDEEIEGKKRKRFTLDGQGSTRERVAAVDSHDRPAKAKGIHISLDLLKEDVPISDYQDVSEVKVRKPKKKSKTSKKRAIDDDEIFPGTTSNVAGNGAMDIDSGPADPAGGQPKRDDSNFLDDDDLQADLATQRRAALKKRKKLRPEDFAKQLREASATPEVLPNTESTEDGPGLVIDETTEFVANLQRPSSPERRPQRSAQPTKSADHTPSSGSDDDGDVPMHDSIDDNHMAVDTPRDEHEESAKAEMSTTGLAEETTLNKGMGGTFSMLTQRGLIKSANSGDLNSIYRDRQKFLAEKQNREADGERKARLQREKDRQSGRLDRMSAREREEHARWNNTQRDQLESRQMADVFNREYKPNVELKYVDEFGRHMSAKEAFKHLSHQFHGKGSGKQKTEKRLKKIEDEKKREAMNTLDSSQHAGKNNAVGATARKKGQAGVRLQ